MQGVDQGPTLAAQAHESAESRALPARVSQRDQGRSADSASSRMQNPHAAHPGTPLAPLAMLAIVNDDEHIYWTEFVFQEGGRIMKMQKP
jgi:hypothetical protein